MAGEPDIRGRRWKALVALALLSLATLLVPALASRSYAATWPRATLNCGDTTAGCHRLRVGINENWASRHYAQGDVDTARAAGLRWLRFPWSWADTEPGGPGDWRWGATDRIMAAANAAGERVIFKPQGSPCWAHPSVPCSVPGPVPPDPAYLPQWQDYIRAVLDRYPGAIAAVEVWNEPNTQSYWAAPISPTRFVHVLQAAYTAVKSVDPAMRVVYGGLSASTVTDSSHMEYGQFLRATLAHGAVGYFDALAIHPYVTGAGRGYLASVKDIIDTVAAVARSRGVTGVPIWVTEFGYASGTDLSEGVQATRLWATLDLLAHTPAVQVAIVHRMYDPDGSAPHYGLLDALGNPKPAYCAVSRWTGAGTCQATASRAGG